MRSVALLLLPALLAQEPYPIRVNVNLIQIDATAADFEVYQNGKRRKISSALWVGGRPPVPPSTPDSPIAILIDNLSLSPSSLHYTR